MYGQKGQTIDNIKSYRNMGSLFTNLVRKVVISRKWTENGPRMDREWTDEVAEKSARMSTVWAMMRVKLVNLVNFVMPFLKWTKWTKWTEQIFDESLKCLKSLMQIFVESAESAKSARSIFATFATFASANFVGKASCESTVRYREWSRISLIKPLLNPYLTLTRFRYSLGSNLSRMCLASLICLCMLTVGVGNAWGAIASGTYVLCTSTSDLEAGAHYIIASGTSGSVYCISNVSQDNYREIVSATVSSSKITVASNSTIMTLTLGGTTGAWTFYTDNYAGTAGYLASAASNSTKNYCRVISTSTTGTISFSSSEAVIALNPHGTRKFLRYNSTNTRFACYSSDNSQAAVYLYKKMSGYSITYHCNDATSGCPSNASSQTALPSTLPTPTRTGCSFGGWYTNSGLTTPAVAGATLAADANLYAKWTCNVTLNRNGVTETINNVVVGTALDDIDGTSAQGGCSEWTFVGWSKTTRAAQNNSATMTLVTEVDGPGPYYAVYSHTESGEGTATFTPGTDTGSTSVTKGDVTCTMTTMNNASYYQIYANQSGTFSISSGNITGISFTCTASGTDKYGPGNASANVGTYSYSSYDGSWTGSASSVTISSTAQIRMTALSIDYSGSVTYYSTTASCCTSLGQINGSISENTPTSVTLTWSAVSGAEKYQVKVPGSSSHNDWTDAVSGVSVTKSCGTAYTAYFRAIDTNGSHCAEGPESTLAIPAVSWTVTSTGVTNATASPAIPSTTCSGFSTTISPATGYALPAEITVTNASKTWNSSTGALTISSVTGNVSITITPTCVPPVISGDPADASYYVGDSPDALSVSATLASGTLTYLWKISTNGGSTWSDATGTNNAATYSGASLSTASAGTLKFKCIVGNSEGGCTVESEVATITVAEPSSWKFKYSGDEWIEHTMIEDAGEVSYSISLAADSRFEFGFDGGSFYKNNGTIITTTSGWVFNTTDNNCHIHTGPAGIYTFTINTTTKAVTVTYPTVSHPNEHYVYFKNTNVWGTVYGYLANSGNDNKAAAWPGSVMQPTTSICGETYHYAALNAMSGTYNTIIFNNGSEGYGNQTSDLSTTGSLGKYNANQDDSWHQFKYAINFDKGTGSGDAMVSIKNLCPGSNQALTANTYTKEHNTFAGWIADVDVKVGESTIDAGEIIDDEVTIKDIQSDINLTAQWTPDTYTITKTLTNVANAGLPSSFTYTGAATTALNSTFTVDATNFFLPSSIAVTMGGTPLTAGTDYTYNNSTGAFTFSAVITGDIDITATATAKLKSIAITMLPTTRKYFAGESFSSTGAVVTATMGDGSTKPVSVTWDLTTLTAGAGQTVTASYSEGGIDQTATTTIDVYSVTVNKVNEDGDAISADGVTATWTVGSKALAAGVGSTKYAFKQWEVTGASIGSTTSASTTLSSPTANVVVNAIFYKPRVVKWSVNGDDSYATGGPTTEVAYNGTISTVPTAPSGLVCAGTFVAWTDAAHNNGTTAKASTSYYESKLFTAANQFPNITAETTTFYAVFAEGTGAAVNTVMWSEDWTGATTSDGSTGKDEAKPSAQGSHSGKTIYGGGSVTYKESSNATYVRNENTGGGTAPELMIKASEAFTISGIPSGGASELTLTYKRNNQALTPTVSGTDYSISYVSGSGKDTHTYTITCGSGTTFNLIFTAGSNNVRLDDVQVKVKTVNLTDYVTECDANIVSVTYNANGGATSCTNTTTDKTEDYTVCSTPPTRDYYTFAGWLCSADDEVYAANATIDDAVIDADFTLTAQWTPIDYDITYNLHGGTTAGGNPTSYNVTTATINLADGTYGHNRFEGWYSTYNDGTGAYSDQVTSIPLGSHGDITLHAKWTTRHEIVFDADGATTTIYRADDEDLSASVAGQGSVPSDPSAPTACSSKVFVGWSESTIDGETDTEPSDLMKPAAGTVDEDKHYYAVWAIESSESGTVTVFNDAFQSVSNGNDYQENKAKPDKYTTNKVYGTGSAGEARMSASSAAGSISIDLSGEDLESTITVSFKLKYWSDSESGSVSLSCMDDGNTASFSNSPFAYPTTSGWKDFSSTVTNVDDKVESITFNSTSGKRVYIKDIVITQTGTVYTYSAYSTSCCATKVTLTQNDPEHGTIAFGKSIVGTCGGDKEVSLTITPAAGYQLSSYEVATGSGKVAAKSVSPAIALNNNSSAAQNITLTFDEDANGAYDVTASFSLMTVTSWTWTMHDGGGAIPDPLNLYVGQSARLDVAYTPSGVDASKKTYGRTKDDAYINFGGGSYTNYTTISGKASTGENTTAVTFTHADGPTKTVNVKVLPLPLTHFVDLVHGKPFADVAATIEANALSATKTTPTSDDWTTPNANECEENHLHLVGWIRSDWPALVAYLAGTGDAPTTVAITGAGNDGSGNAYFFAPNASINVLTFNGATFYAVWAEIK